jgi:hypothetical protein
MRAHIKATLFWHETRNCVKIFWKSSKFFSGATPSLIRPDKTEVEWRSFAAKSQVLSPKAQAGFGSALDGTEKVIALVTLNTIIIPRIEFRDATIREAIDFLRERAAENDTSDTSVDRSGPSGPWSENSRCNQTNWIRRLVSRSHAREMHDAIEFHIEGLRAAGEEIPMPRSEASYCEVAA